jgi:hypothetical protein
MPQLKNKIAVGSSGIGLATASEAWETGPDVNWQEIESE